MQLRPRTVCFVLVILAVLALLVTRPAAAQTYEFTNGSGDSNWDTAANWLLVGSNPPVNAVPYSQTADALINAGQVNKSGGVIYLRSLSMGLGAGVNLYGVFNVFANPIVGGNLYLRPDANGNSAFYTNGAMELQNVAFQCVGSSATAILPFPGSTLTVDAGSTLTGKLGLIGGYGNSTLINYGVITSNLLGVADPRFTIYPTLSLNYGTIQTAVGTNLSYYLNQHHNMDYGVINASGYVSCVAAQFTNHTLGTFTAGGRIDVYAAAQFNNYGILNAQQLGIGPDSRVSNYDAGRIQIVNGTLDVLGLMEAGQLTLSGSDLRTGDSTALKLLATNSTPATLPLAINNLFLNGGAITGGTLNAIKIGTENSHNTQLIGTMLNGTIDGSTNNVTVNLTGTTLAGGTIDMTSGPNTDSILAFAGQGQNASILNNTTIQGQININVYPDSELTVGNGTQITGNLGQIGFIYGGQSGSIITNDGAISTTGVGNRTFISPAVLINNGLIASSGGANLNFGYGYNLVTNSPTGVIQANGNDIVIYDGIFHNQGSLSAINCNIQTLITAVVDLGKVTLNGGVFAWNDSTVNVTQGIPNSYIEVHDFATGNMIGGPMIEADAHDNSILNVSGGQFDYLYSFDNATINLTGGKPDDLYSGGSSTINVSGGQIGTLSTSATINVYGRNLTKTVTRQLPYATYYALTGVLADGTIWKNKTGIEYTGGHINIATIQNVGIPINVVIKQVKSLVRDGNSVRTQITVTNLGSTVAQNVALKGAKLGSQSAATMPLPSTPTLASGASVTWNLVFPAPATGAHTVLSLAGTYKGGQFGGAYRVVTP